MVGHTKIESSPTPADSHNSQHEDQSRSGGSAQSSDCTEKKDMLQQAMKYGARDLHAVAEKSNFIVKVISGGITRQSYRLFLADLYYIYSALEEEVEKNKHHPVLGAVYFPEQLNRRQAIEKDLEFFFGKEWAKKAKCTFAAGRYVERIRHLGKSDPAALVAHCYGRYLGDLSGGQILRYRLGKNLNLKPIETEDSHMGNNDGLSFYRFENIDNLKKFKDFYSARINSLTLDVATFQNIVDENRVVFQLNIDLFTELDILAEIIPGGYTTGNSSIAAGLDDSVNPGSSVDGQSNEGSEPYAPSTISVSSWSLQCFEKAWLLSTYALFAATLFSFAFAN